MAVTKRQIFKVVFIGLFALIITGFVFLMVFKVQIFTGPVFHLQFEHVGSLTVGAVVRTSGVRIGTVSNIGLNTADYQTVIVTVTLYPNQKVRRNARFLVMSGSLIGDQYVEVLPSKDGDFIKDGETFKGEPIKNLDSFLLSSDTLIKDFTTAMSALAEILTENKDNIRKTIANLESSSAALKTYLSEDKERGPSLLKKMSDLMDSLDKSSNAMAVVLNELSAQDSVVSLMSQKETSADVKATLSNLRKMSETMKILLDDIAGLSPSPKANEEKK